LAWQHVFVSVVPEALLDYCWFGMVWFVLLFCVLLILNLCSAPFPFVLGIHASLMPRVRRMPMDEHVVVDVDAGTVSSPFNDDKSMPTELVCGEWGAGHFFALLK
jgi:hypothetical protein